MGRGHVTLGVIYYMRADLRREGDLSITKFSNAPAKEQNVSFAVLHKYFVYFFAVVLIVISSVKSGTICIFIPVFPVLAHSRCSLGTC